LKGDNLVKILIATDGSEFSDAAVETVCRIFPDLYSVEIKVLSVHDDHLANAADPFAVSGEYYQQLSDASEKNARFYAVAAAETIRKRAGHGDPQIAIEVLSGPPGKVIVETAEAWGADLIVVGSHGRGFWGRMIGSTSDAVVHHAPCSVIVVRK
jgi:nucleotide-binding universal stress UspA family protein